MAQFKKGDVVRLKSGGPTMTIKFIEEPKGVCCAWFNDKKELKEEFFEAEFLEVVEFPKGGARLTRG